MTIVTRHILASSERCREFCATIPPSTVRYRETWGVHDRIITAGDIVASQGPVEPSARYIDVEVDLDALSPAARRMAEHTPAPLNRLHPDFWLETGLTNADAGRWTPRQREVYADQATQPHRVKFPWPTINNEEAGEAYYERCAKMARYFEALCKGGIAVDQALLFMSHAARYAKSWDIDQEVAYQLRPPCRCPGCKRRAETDAGYCRQHESRRLNGQDLQTGRRA
jgi:hypothetical protein